MYMIVAYTVVMPPPYGALSDDGRLTSVVWRLSVRLTSVCLSVCPSVAYIGPNSRMERPMKTTIGTEVAHVTWTPLSRSKGQRSTCRGRGHAVSVRQQAAQQFNVHSRLRILICFICKLSGLGGGLRLRVSASILVTLRAKLSGAVYFNRSCLWVCLFVCVFVGLLPR